MVRKERHHFDNLTPTDPMAPKSLTKQDFGRRLKTLMLSKGWNQSELGRRSDLNRSAISTYVTGKVFPTDKHLVALAEALGVEPDMLLPNRVEAAIEADEPSMELKVSPGDPRQAWLRVNRRVTLATAIKVMDLLENDKP